MIYRPALFVVLVLLLFSAGCTEEQRPAAPVVKKPEKVEAPIPKASAALIPPEIMPTAPPYAYNPGGRRDPFKPLIEARKVTPLPSTTNVPLTPLQRFELNQLRLIGVIVGKGEPMAMVSTLGGKSYLLKKGVKVGMNNGVVVGIDTEGVTVEEKFYDFAGEILKKVQKIELPKREGAN